MENPSAVIINWRRLSLYGRRCYFQRRKVWLDYIHDQTPPLALSKLPPLWNDPIFNSKNLDGFENVIFFLVEIIILGQYDVDYLVYTEVQLGGCRASRIRSSSVKNNFVNSKKK